MFVQFSNSSPPPWFSYAPPTPHAGPARLRHSLTLPLPQFEEDKVLRRGAGMWALPAEQAEVSIRTLLGNLGIWQHF